MVENKHKGNNAVGKGDKIMTLNEELDKIILDNAGSCSESSSMCKIKSEILALIERKLNEVVPKFRETSCGDRYENAKAIYTMQQNIKKVLEGK